MKAPVISSILLLLASLLPVPAGAAKEKTKPPFELSGYTQLRYERFTEKEDGGDPVREYEARRARVKLVSRPMDRMKLVLGVDVSDKVVEWKNASIGYDLRNKRDFVLGLQEWPFGYEVTRSSSEREAPERALVFRRLFPGQRDRGAVVESKSAKDLDLVVGLFDGSGTDEYNYNIRNSFGDKIGEGTKTVSSDYNNHKDLVGRALWSRGNAEFGFSGYIGEGIWNKKRTKMLDEKKQRFGGEFRYFGKKWALMTEWVAGRGVDESDKDFSPSDWVSGGYVQVSRDISARDTMALRFSTMSQDPNEPDLGRRSAWDVGWLRWLNDQTRIRVFYQINTESGEKIDNNGFIGEWMVVY